MKALKITLCLAIVAACVGYAAKVTLGPTSQGLMFVANDPGVSLEEYVVTNDVGIKDWVLLVGGGPKTKIILDAKSGAQPNGANINIGAAKMFKGKKTAGATMDNVLFGIFSPVGGFNPQDLGIMTNFAPGEGIIVKMKGASIGTVIAADNKLVLADALMKYATDSGFKGKGGAVKTTAGNVGGTFGDMGWIGVPPELQPIAALNDYGDGCKIKMIKAKGAVDSLDLYATPIKPTKSKLFGKVAGTVTAHNTTSADWKTKNVTIVTP